MNNKEFDDNIKNDSITNPKVIENLYINRPDVVIQNFNNIETVLGYLHISCKEFYSDLKSLENIKIIKGDAYLRYSFISDLGSLEQVDGNLNLRDTLITKLGKLRLVKGNLNLPKRLESELDIKNVKVLGNIKFWNDDKYWERLNFEESLELEKIKSEYHNHHHIYYNNGEFDKAWELYRNYNLKVLKRGILVPEIYNYEKKLGKRLIEPIDVITTTGTSILNNHTIKNLDNFKNHLNQRINNIYSEHNDYFNLVFKISKIDFKKLNSSFLIKSKGKSSKDSFVFNEETFVSYKHHFDSEKEYFFKKNQLKTHFKINYVPQDYFNCFLESALIERLKKIVREEEDEFRMLLGLPKIGEGWISETELYQKIKKHLKDYEVIHHGKPKWLGRQHFDIWIPKLNIAIEYQGLQHDIAVDYFGGETNFEANKKRDEIKKQLCVKNKCMLIEVRPNYDFEEVINQIEHELILYKSLKINK